MKHFGKAFCELLYHSGATQKSVGDKLGISHVTVTRMKEQASIDAAMLEKICHIFNVPITYFFDGVTETPAQESGAGEIELELLRSENTMLHRLVDEKERTIQILLKQ